MLAWHFEHLELDHRTCIYDTKVGHDFLDQVPGAGLRYFRSNGSSTLTIPNISKSLSEDFFDYDMKLQIIMIYIIIIILKKSP